MPPKKTKAQPASSGQPARQTRSVSKEPAPEPARPTRGGRKRRHSDASNASEQSANAPASTPSKRRKRGKPTVTAESELLELPQVIEEEQDELAGDQGTTSDSIEISQSSEKHVHFRPGHNENTDDVDEMDIATATHITPHPRKMAIKRRLTASPSINGNSRVEKRVKRTSVRRSLPPSLSQQDGESFYVVEEREFAPLREVLQERVMQRARIHELKLELSTEREQGNAQKIEEIEEELAQLSQEQRDVVAESESEDVDVLDENMLVLASQEEIAYPDLQRASLSFNLTRSDYVDRKVSKEIITEELSLSQPQSRSQEMAWNAERKQLQDAILSLSQEVSNAQTKLQIFELEVQNLGFGGGSTSAADVLVTIRESVAHAREKIEAVLPDSIPNDASNEDLIEIIAASVQEFAERLRTSDEDLAQKSSLLAELSQQVQGLIDHLAEAELRKQKLEQSWAELDVANEEKAREIEDLQEEIQALEDQRDNLQDELQLRETEYSTLQEENKDFTTSVKRLTASLQDYRNEEQRLSDLITRMEEEHRSTVTNMNRERENTVQDLENRLDEQTSFRAEAAQLSEERLTLITNMELEIETLTVASNAARDELARVIVQRDQEQDGREVAEADLQEKAGEVEDLSARVDRLETELAELDEKKNELCQKYESESGQREAAERDLDDRNIEVDQLNQQLNESGKQANELRQKLFEVQQLNERKIKELEVAAYERDEQFQNDIAQEVERRQSAEEVMQEYSDRISDLEAQIEEIEERMRIQLAERDDRIDALEIELAQKDAEIETLHDNFRNAERLHRTYVTENDHHRAQLDAKIDVLEESVSEQEAQIASLQQEALSAAELHDSEIENRNSRIAELNHEVVEAREHINELKNEKDSLELRVEQEAEQMLTLQNEKTDEIEVLKATIRDKQEKIRVIEEKAYEADRSWQAVLEARDEEIAAMRTSEGESSQTITTLTGNIEALRRLLHDYLRRSNGKLAALQKDAAARLATIEEDRAELEAEGEQILHQVDSMEAFQMTEIVTTTSSAHQEQVQHQAVRKTRGRKKRVMDSGIGVDEDEYSPVAI